MMIKLAILTALCATFVYFYLDGRVPEPLPEQWKVKVIDAMMKTYGHTISTLVKMGATEYFSNFDRQLSDWFILTMTTGFPWGLGYDSKLQITDTRMKGVRIKMYQPVASLGLKKRPVLVYFHGGGWSMLSVDSYDPFIRKLTKESGIVIISVDYRLSPQYPYPTPLHDCMDVVEYVMDNSDLLGVDQQKIAIGGDSAGGNIAAAISLRLKDKIAMQLLLVPCLQFSNWNTTSVIENTLYMNKSINAPESVVFVLNYLNVDPKYAMDFLSNNHTSPAFKRSRQAEMTDQNIWMPKRYVRDQFLRENIENQINYGNEELFSVIESKITDPMAAPLLAEDDMLEGIPFTYIMTCGYDFIRDDGIMFSERLRQIGQPVTLTHYYEGFHNALFFPQGPLKLDIGVKIMGDIVKNLKERLT